MDFSRGSERLEEFTERRMEASSGPVPEEKLVRDLNPLNKVEISITRRDGTMESRFLDFKFARVMVESKLEHLLGSVTDVTKEVNKYIKENNLQNPANKKEIKADSTLTKLLNLKKGDDLNYFSLQKFLKDHFPKADTSVSA